MYRFRNEIKLQCDGRRCDYKAKRGGKQDPRTERFPPAIPHPEHQYRNKSQIAMFSAAPFVKVRIATDLRHRQPHQPLGLTDRLVALSLNASSSASRNSRCSIAALHAGPRCAAASASRACSTQPFAANAVAVVSGAMVPASGERDRRRPLAQHRLHVAGQQRAPDAPPRDPQAATITNSPISIPSAMSGFSTKSADQRRRRPPTPRRRRPTTKRGPGLSSGICTAPDNVSQPGELARTPATKSKERARHTRFLLPLLPSGPGGVHRALSAGARRRGGELLSARLRGAGEAE